MCAFKIKPKVSDFVPIKHAIKNFPKGFNQRIVDNSKAMKRGTMEHAGGMHDFLSDDIDKAADPKYFSKHKKGNRFGGMAYHHAAEKWDSMRVTNRVEAAHNTGRDMSGFMSKDKKGLSVRGFKELSTPNKKALGKYFGVF